MSRYALPLLLAAAVPALAACGSSNDPSNSQIASKQASALAFSQCMRSHGVPNFPDPGSNGHGGVQIQATHRIGSGNTMTVNGVPVSAPSFQSAQQACQSKLPNGGRPSAADIARAKAAALTFSACMRTHGVPNFPDPQFQGGGKVLLQGGGAGFDPSSPAFKTAQQKCGSIIGQKGGGLQVAAGP